MCLCFSNVYEGRLDNSTDCQIMLSYGHSKAADFECRLMPLLEQRCWPADTLMNEQAALVGHRCYHRLHTLSCSSKLLSSSERRLASRLFEGHGRSHMGLHSSCMMLDWQVNICTLPASYCCSTNICTLQANICTLLATAAVPKFSAGCARMGMQA